MTPEQIFTQLGGGDAAGAMRALYAGADSRSSRASVTKALAAALGVTTKTVQRWGATLGIYGGARKDGGFRRHAHRLIGMAAARRLRSGGPTPDGGVAAPATGFDPGDAVDVEYDDEDAGTRDIASFLNGRPVPFSPTTGWGAQMIAALETGDLKGAADELSNGVMEAYGVQPPETLFGADYPDGGFV